MRLHETPASALLTVDKYILLGALCLVEALRPVVSSGALRFCLRSEVFCLNPLLLRFHRLRQPFE